MEDTKQPGGSTENQTDTTTETQPNTDVGTSAESNTTAPATEQKPTGAEAGIEQQSKKSLIVVAVIVVIGAIVAVVIFMSGAGGGSLSLTGGSSAGAAVAMINGEEVSREKFTDSVTRTEQLALQQGLDVNDPSVREEIESQSLTVVVNTALLIQAAENAAIEVSTEEVDAQIETLKTQYGGQEAFESAIAEAGLSNEEVQVDIREQIMVDRYINNTPEFQELAVTDAEIQTAYESITEGQEDAPSLEEVSEVIESQILGQKQQQAVSAVIERLRSEAEIEILI